MEFTKEQMLKMHEYLVFSRGMAEKIIEYIFSGKISGAIHPGLGQEAICAGILAAIDISPRKIYRHCTHRQQPLIAKTVGLDLFLGELMNKRTGIFHGTSGEYHLVSLKDLLLPMCGILGDGLLTGVGFAWSLKADGKDDSVALVSIGDGAMSEGSTYEGINLAAILKLPILFVIENNQVAMTTPIEEQSPIPELYRRAEAAGLRGIGVDGNDVEAVTAAILEGVSNAAACEPMIIELKSWRWEGHYVGDDQSKYRDASFREDTSGIDPLLLYEQRLLERNVADRAYMDKVRAEHETLLSDAFARAAAQEYPSKEECLDYGNIYSNDAGGAI
ncbi:MAG: thiamine pyrophosphate-dependent dehydrogenase E1 component subunit alpha [Clostridiales Family XIII bacterium]|jgi:pyruvate dehydrogenase E1 component alpha subunit|nr:thiamine pyrophosphate-dependent dehydrogenase E1 component subunit alpha [Clostridiales Family XIII bacterium]